MNRIKKIKFEFIFVRRIIVTIFQFIYSLVWFNFSPFCFLVVVVISSLHSSLLTSDEVFPRGPVREMTVLSSTHCTTR